MKLLIVLVITALALVANAAGTSSSKTVIRACFWQDNRSGETYHDANTTRTTPGASRFCVVGRRGKNGLNGKNGAAGAVGAKGDAGLVGARGPAGLNGKDGSAAARGATGLAGPRGAIGPAGVAGPRGVPGAQGVPGPKGDTGATGPAGPPGGEDSGAFITLCINDNGGSVRVDTGDGCNHGHEHAVKVEVVS